MSEKTFYERLTGHFKTITSHRHEVMKNCFRVGLYRQGLMHDLSKYTPVEFCRGVKYYLGNKSPNEAERLDTGVSRAWLHHKGRNLHHLEYWIDYNVNDGGEGKMAGMEMPLNYLMEMVCDRIAASKIYMKDAYTDQSPLAYYEKGKGHYMLHPVTRRQLERLLTMLAEKGEDYTFAFMRQQLKKYRASKRH